MAKLSQKQLDELAKERKGGIQNSSLALKNIDTFNATKVNPKIITEIMNEDDQAPYKYKLPKNISVAGEGVPYVDHAEYPYLNIKGKFSSDRQIKGANLFVLKEIDHVLNEINIGKNKNATLNFLLWVGLQTIKGMNGTLDIKVHDSTYADGEMVSEYIDEKK